MDGARHWHWRKFGWLNWLWPPVGVLLLIFGTIIVREPASRGFGGVCIGTGVYCLLRKWIFGIQNRRGIRKSPYYRKAISWQIQEHQLSAETEGATWSVAWDNFYETLTTPDGLLLYPYKNMYYWLPKTAFGSEQDYEDAKRIIATASKHRELQ